MVSIHAAEELDDDNLTILDLENIILTGEIIERQGRRAVGRKREACSAAWFRMKMASPRLRLSLCDIRRNAYGFRPTSSTFQQQKELRCQENHGCICPAFRPTLCRGAITAWFELHLQRLRRDKIPWR
ncbi:MAG: DUF4258 domain-containing protein [Gammaproteobacteria bacterium]